MTAPVGVGREVLYVEGNVRTRSLKEMAEKLDISLMGLYNASYRSCNSRGGFVYKGMHFRKGDLKAMKKEEKEEPVRMEWHKFPEEIPPKNGEYLVVFDGREISAGALITTFSMFDRDKLEWYFRNSRKCETSFIKAWMPMPKLPSWVGEKK